MLSKITRDWRFRTVVPVILIHLTAFAGLYVVMHRFAVANLIEKQKFGASVLLDELEANFDEWFRTEDASVGDRLRKQASAHRLFALAVYDGIGRPLTYAGSAPSEEEVAQARELIGQQAGRTEWIVSETPRYLLHGARAIGSCDSCPQRPSVVQIGLDLNEAVAGAKSRVIRQFGLVGVAWLALVAVMATIRAHVIGRPLADIEKSITALEPRRPPGSSGHDLEALATRLHRRIWNMIDEHKKREDDMAQQMARAEQLAALGELAAGLTHEIKNPLAGVIAALELIRAEQAEDSLHRGVCDEMLTELRRVASTVTSLLRLAKPQPPHRVETDLRRVVREVTSLFAARLSRSGVELEVEVSEDVPLLRLDSGLMVQLLVNLLTNSMQASERGGSIKVLLAPFPLRDGIVLAVSDTGKGIDAEHLSKIFDPFFTTKEEGTGLGLPICRQIVEQHGGTINIESKPGGGTRVVVLLPDEAAAETGYDTAVVG